MTDPFLSPSLWGIVLMQLVVATVCGGIIGFQREMQESAAGFRTHILVCVGSTIYMLVSLAVAGTTHDPGRIAAQVATGIGFLGAGTIIKQGSLVRGLTTGASLWAVAAIGLAIGNGVSTMVVAILGTLVVFLALGFLKNIERFFERVHACFISFTMPEPRKQLEQIRQQLTAHGIDIHGLDIEERPDANPLVCIDARVTSKDDLDRAVTDLTRNNTIRDVRWGVK